MEREYAGKIDRKKVIYDTDLFSTDVACLDYRESAVETVILRRKGMAAEIVPVRAGEPEKK